MSFQDELNRWAASQLSKFRGESAKAQIERLIREILPRSLPPLSLGQALPGEVRSGARASDYQEPVAGYDWICWPSSDGAVFGWGDPYGPNPPLGTVQTSFSDTARIARELSQSDQVTHGVNKIAGLRDWRFPPLLISWDESSIYSNGAVIKTGASIRAACIRYTGEVPYLIWMETDSNPSRVWAQECTIINDIVVGVVGSPEHCTITVNVDIWSEFSQDGNKLAVSYSSLTSRTALEYTVPTSFTGQQAAFIVLRNTPQHDIDYVNIGTYDGSRTYLLKAQYKGDTPVYVELKMRIRRDGSGFKHPLAFESYTSLGYVPGTRYQCAAGCSGGTENAPLEFNMGPLDGFQKYEVLNGFLVTAEILIDAVPVYSKDIVEDVFYTLEWCTGTGGLSQVFCLAIGDAELGRPAIDEPLFTGPSEVPGWPCVASPATGRCIPEKTVTIEIEDRNNQFYDFIPQDTIDARFDRVIKVTLGDSDDNGITKNKRLQIDILRDGVLKDSKMVAGEYGYLAMPDRNDIGSEQELKDNIDLAAIRFCPTSGIGVTGFGRFIDTVALDVSDARTVQWIRALHESSGQRRHINLLEGAVIEDLLSISGETEPRIVVHDSQRWFGKLK